MHHAHRLRIGLHVLHNPRLYIFIFSPHLNDSDGSLLKKSLSVREPIHKTDNVSLTGRGLMMRALYCALRV